MTIGGRPDKDDHDAHDDVKMSIPYAQITEVTGVQDRATIAKTWNNCAVKGVSADSITSEVISSLLRPVTSPTSSNHGERLPTQSTLSVQPSPISIIQQPRSRTNSMDTQTGNLQSPKPVIDLTSDDEMQKAIAASLETQTSMPSMLGGQITREDQDISRVLEASLAETKSVDGKKNPIWFFDHVNPHERCREDSWPVGLKNVGNTCWFNAVIQSLFHLETFRELVVNYAPGESLDKDGAIAVFVTELRRLFALMLASNRKYLNPSSAIQILKQSFSSGGAGEVLHIANDQQDVSEFQHKLLDWLEEAFQHTARPGAGKSTAATVEQSGSGDQMEVDIESKEKDSSNAMVRLFYGKLKTIGTNAGEAFTTHTHFGQWPLYVAGYSDIHQSLEAGLARGDIETNDAEQTSNQEQWFTHLPPLMTFELSRFRYNTMQLQAEKLHNRFSFPQTLFLDRYLEANQEEVREKRSKLWRLRAELLALESSLHKYTHFGSGTGQYPLSDILDYALQFATSATNTPLCPIHRNLAPQTSHTGDDPRCNCPQDQAACQPRPKNINSDELAILTSCLGRWGEEVKSTIETLQKSIHDLSQDIAQTYEQDHLKQHKYSLHAVMVHEGQALSGHYWSYVCNADTGGWLKFNDICVTESSWDEVVRESEGGNSTASAYCLIYVQDAFAAPTSAGRTSVGITSPSGEYFLSKEEALARLPADLQVHVAEDNQRLQDEIYQWDFSKAVITADQHGNMAIPQSQSGADILSTTPMDTSYTNIPGGIKTCVDEYARNNAQSLLTMVRNKYNDIVKQYGTTVSWTYKLELLVKACFNKYYEVSQDVEKAGRLDNRAHMALYLLIVYEKTIDHNDVKALITDHIARVDNTSDISGWTNIRREAVQMAAGFWERSSEFQSNYMRWHQEYHQFRVVFTLFVEGLGLLNSERYEDALPYLHDAYIRNVELMKVTQVDDVDCNVPMRALDRKLLAKVRNTCLLRLNEMAFTQFENDDDYMTPLKVMLLRVLPILDSLQSGDLTIEDSNFAGSIKDRWIHLLAEESTMEGHRMEALKEFLGQLFEPASHPAPMIENVKVMYDLGTRFKLSIQKYTEKPFAHP